MMCVFALIFHSLLSLTEAQKAVNLAACALTSVPAGKRSSAQFKPLSGWDSSPAGLRPRESLAHAEERVAQ